MCAINQSKSSFGNQTLKGLLQCCQARQPLSICLGALLPVSLNSCLVNICHILCHISTLLDRVDQLQRDYSAFYNCSVACYLPLSLTYSVLVFPNPGYHHFKKFLSLLILALTSNLCLTVMLMADSVKVDYAEP